MRLECPNCSVHFKVTAQALGEVGRTVRCSQCAFEWFAEPRDLKENHAQHVPAPEVTEGIVPEESGEDIFASLDALEPSEDVLLERRAARRGSPAPTKPPSMLPAISALCASIIFCIIGGLLYFNAPLRQLGLGGLYDSAGMEQSPEMKLANLSITKLEGKRTAYALKGTVVNTTTADQPIPALRIRLVSEVGEVLREWEYEQPGMIKAGENLPFSADKLETMDNAAAYAFQVDIGSSFELSLRD